MCLRQVQTDLLMNQEFNILELKNNIFKTKHCFTKKHMIDKVSCPVYIDFIFVQNLAKRNKIPFY